MPDDYRKRALEASRHDEGSTKARILRAAGYLFSRKGYKETTTREISELAGVNLALVHYHWGSKEELWNAVHQQLLVEMWDFVGGLFESFPVIEDTDKLEDFMYRLFDFVADRPNMIRLMAQPGPAGRMEKWWEKAGIPLMEAGLDYLERSGDINFEPVDTRLALLCLGGSVMIFFARPELVSVLFDEDPENYSEDFRRSVAQALAVMMLRFARRERGQT